MGEMKYLWVLILVLLVSVAFFFLMFQRSIYDKWSLETVPEEVFKEDERFLNEVLGIGLTEVTPVRRLTFYFMSQVSKEVSAIPHFLQGKIARDIFFVEYEVNDAGKVYLGTSLEIPRVIFFAHSFTDVYTAEIEKWLNKGKRNRAIFNTLLNYLELPEDLSYFECNGYEIDKEKGWRSMTCIGVKIRDEKINRFVYPELDIKGQNEKEGLWGNFKVCFLGSSEELLLHDFYLDISTSIIDQLLYYTELQGKEHDTQE